MAWHNKFPLSLTAVTIAASALLFGCNVGKTDTVAASGTAAGTTGTTTTTKSGCTGSYVGSIVAPPYEVRIANRNRQLTETGFPITGNDAVDNANTTGGGVDGGMYLEGSYAWETDVNCTVVKGTAVVFGYEFPIDGKVNADKTFNLNYFGPIIGSVDGNNDITGQLQEGGKTWVYGELRGKFTPNGKI
jgi:hypothetical protein